MSMFYELMMRKKEENFLYPVIKGSLTESPSGVFSGFSSSNYLEKATSISLSIQELEVVLDITMTSFASEGLCVFSTNTFNVQFYSQSTTYKKINLGGSQITGTKEYLLNTNYKIKLKFYVVGSSIHLDIYYLEGSNWILDASYTNLPYTLISKFILGDNYSHTGTRVFTGSYNLNNSYMILDGTKYNLQAVVGYIVVGSPTITDGVVSGFSTSNYLLLGANVPYSNNFEMVFKITTSSSFSSTNTIFEGSSSSNNGLSIAINTSKYLYVSAGNGSWIVNQAGTTTLSANTTYYVKFSCKNNVYKLELSTDNINWNTEISVESSSVLVTTSAKSIGYSTRFSGRVFSGSIDMNETYIKINNKLWFNGQQA